VILTAVQSLRRAGWERGVFGGRRVGALRAQGEL